MLENKLIFIETKDTIQTIISLDHYKQACDNGRGAVFFATARSTIAESMNFVGHYGRCIIIYGIPFQNTLTRNLRVRMLYNEERLGIN